MRTAYKTDTGHVRTINEDTVVVEERQLHGFTLAILADGMGGHQAGDVASRIAVEVVQRELQSISSETALADRVDVINRAISLANVEIARQSAGDGSLSGMGTTIVMALVQQDLIILAHVGDSRAYLLRDGKLLQLTEDHSLVNELLKSGQITNEEAIAHPRKNIITQALGSQTDLQIDNRVERWDEGEVLLLCSDGLSDLVRHEQIETIMLAEGSLAQKADQLVAQALAAGGDDNVTVVLVAHDEASG